MFNLLVKECVVFKNMINCYRENQDVFFIFGDSNINIIQIVEVNFGNLKYIIVLKLYYSFEICMKILKERNCCIFLFIYKKYKFFVKFLV